MCIPTIFHRPVDVFWEQFISLQLQLKKLSFMDPKTEILQ